MLRLTHPDLFPYAAAKGKVPDTYLPTASPSEHRPKLLIALPPPGEALASGIANQRARVNVSIVRPRPTECDASSSRVVVTVAGAGVVYLRKVAHESARNFPRASHYAVSDSLATADFVARRCPSREVPLWGRAPYPHLSL